MCVVNKPFQLHEFVFDSVYVDLQYDEISLTFTAGFVLCLWTSLVCLSGCHGTLCGCGGCCACDVCTVVGVACVSVERVRWYEIDGNAGVVSAGHVGSARGSGIVSSAAAKCGTWDERSWWSYYYYNVYFRNNRHNSCFYHCMRETMR